MHGVIKSVEAHTHAGPLSLLFLRGRERMGEEVEEGGKGGRRWREGREEEGGGTEGGKAEGRKEKGRKKDVKGSLPPSLPPSFPPLSVGLGQLEGKLRWEGCQGVSTAAVLRRT